MKASLICLSSLFVFSCVPLPTLVQFTAEENFVQVFDELPATQDDLFTKANAWLVSIFRDADSEVQYVDKEEGIIIGKYLLNGRLTPVRYGAIDSRIFAVIDIRVRDNRAKVEIMPQAQWHSHNFLKDDAIQAMTDLSASLHNALLSENEF